VKRLLLAVVLLVGFVVVLSPDEQTHPPHARPAAMGGGTGAAPAEVSGAAHAGEVFVFVEGVAREEWFKVVAEEEARRAAVAATRPRAAERRVSSGGGSCSGFVIPGDIVWGESRCDYGAVNPSGCSGYSCVGAYQFDARHWDASSGWGGCADLGDWQVPANQDECARRLSRDGTYLAPWGR